MRRTALFALVLLAACGSRPQAQLRLVGGLEQGTIRRNLGREELEAEFGSSRVRSAKVDVGEGETRPGVELFPDDSLERLTLLWRDSAIARGVARAILRGSRSRWRLPHGITLGTPLTELERINGRPFTLAGFGWDYSGAVIDWKGGRLADILAYTKVYLSPPSDTLPGYARVLGDREYWSNNPAMQELKPSHSVWICFSN